MSQTKPNITILLGMDIEDQALVYSYAVRLQATLGGNREYWVFQTRFRVAFAEYLPAAIKKFYRSITNQIPEEYTRPSETEI